MFNIPLAQLLISGGTFLVANQNLGYNRLTYGELRRNRQSDERYHAAVLAALTGQYYEGMNSMYDKIRTDAHERMMQGAAKAEQTGGASLHGMADAKAAHDWAMEKCSGDACEFKMKLMPLVVMLGGALTPFQREYVEDRLKSFRGKAAMMGDPTQRAEAEHWLDKLEQQLWKSEHGTATAVNTQSFFGGA